MSAHSTPPPRSPIPTKRNETRTGTLKVPASASQKQTYPSRSLSDGQAAQVADGSAQGTNVIHDGPYIPSKYDSTARHSVNSTGFNDVHVIGKSTRDSMVENMLLSFNKIPNGQVAGRSYPPSSYIKSGTVVGDQPTAPNSPQSKLHNPPPEADLSDVSHVASPTASVPRHNRRLSAEDYMLYEGGRDNKGQISHTRGASASQARRHQGQTTSVDLTAVRGQQSVRPATAPHRHRQAAPSPTISAGSRTLHSASPTSPRLSQQGSQPTSVALAAAAAALTTQKQVERSQQVSPTTAREAVKSNSVRPLDEATSAETARQPRLPSRDTIDRDRPSSKNESIPERPLISPGSRTTSDMSTRKSSTTRSISDRALSRAGSVDSEGRPLKQRSGFFRRVFGPSRSYSSTSPQGTPLPTQPEEPPQFEKPPQLPPLNVKSHRPEKPRARMNPNQYAGQLLYLPNPPSPSPPQEISDPLSKLNKKTSFFRRKRRGSEHEIARSVDESEEVLTISSHSRTTSSTATAEPSPSISSLRKVMNPYLLGPSGSSRTTSPQDLIPSNYFNRNSADMITEEQVNYSLQEVATGSVQASHLTPSRNEMSQVSPSLAASSVQAPVVVKMKRAHVVEEENKNPYVIDGSPILNRDSASFSEVTPKRNESPKRQRTGWTRLGDETSPALDFSNVANLHSTSIDVLGLRAVNQPEEVQTPTQSTSLPSDDGWIMTSPVKKLTQEVVVSKPHRIWLKSSASEELMTSDRWPLPPPSPQERLMPMTAQPSIPEEIIVTNTNTPTKHTDTSDTIPRVVAASPEISAFDPTDPTEAENQLARKIYHGPSAGFDQDQAAMALGEAGLDAQRLRRAYMSLFDFTGTNILLGMRELCGRLALKGETQQVDRILLAFSQRWTECNPAHGLKSLDVIHTLCYSLLLLNTDLHVAELEQKMTRNQFVKNTLFAITHSVDDSDTDSTMRSLSKTATPLREEPPPLPKSPMLGSDSFLRRPSLEARSSEGRLSIRSSMRPISTVRQTGSPTPYDARPLDAIDTLMNSPFRGSDKAWEAQLEILLKEFYNSVRMQRLPLFGAKKPAEPANTGSGTNTWLHRSGSTISKGPVEITKSLAPSFRSVSSRWGSKNKSRPNIYASSTLDSNRASRTSLDDPSFWTPSPSSTWSRSFRGKPPGTMSSDSLGTHLTSGGDGFGQSIGFANTLSHAIIREEFMSGSESDGPVEVGIEEEELGLAGAPWAKEGIVQYKHHLDENDKKARDRNWNECFAVVEKGSMHLFSFNSKGSVRNQKKRNVKQGAIVGGGNWTENAETVDSFTLRQTLANILPAPGYSKARPHVFALSLPNGAVHLFGVGTHEIAEEFVATANYWSARLSKEPLMGGISNIEYGWGDSIVNSASSPRPETTASMRPSTSKNGVSPSYPPSAGNFAASLGFGSRPSIQASIRNSFDGGNARPRLPGDRIQLNDWTPPQQSLMASTLSEDEQLEALQAYVHGVEEELERHNELRPVMLQVFSNRHPNAAKAMNNWEKKSSYLLREIVKFRTYIDSLTTARRERARVLSERSGSISGVMGRRAVVAASTASTTPRGESFRDPVDVRRMEELSLRDDGAENR